MCFTEENKKFFFTFIAAVLLLSINIAQAKEVGTYRVAVTNRFLHDVNRPLDPIAPEKTQKGEFDENFNFILIGDEVDNPARKSCASAMEEHGVNSIDALPEGVYCTSRTVRAEIFYPAEIPDGVELVPYNLGDWYMGSPLDTTLWYLNVESYWVTNCEYQYFSGIGSDPTRLYPFLEPDVDPDPAKGFCVESKPGGPLTLHPDLLDIVATHSFSRQIAGVLKGYIRDGEIIEVPAIKWKKFPVIIVQHGNVGLGLDMSEYAGKIASAGYIAVNIDVPSNNGGTLIGMDPELDNFNRGLEFTNFIDPYAGPSGFLLETVYLNAYDGLGPFAVGTEENAYGALVLDGVYKERVADVDLAIHSAQELNENDPLLSGSMDIKRFGMTGHSWGGWNSQTSPAYYPEIKAGVSLQGPGVVNFKEFVDESFWEEGSILLPLERDVAYKNLAAPTMYLNGAEDEEVAIVNAINISSPPEGFKSKEPTIGNIDPELTEVFKSTNQPVVLVHLKNVNHLTPIILGNYILNNDPELTQLAADAGFPGFGYFDTRLDIFDPKLKKTYKEADSRDTIHFAAEMAVLFFNSYIKDDFHSRKELRHFNDERIFKIKNRNIKLYKKDKKFSHKK